MTAQDYFDCKKHSCRLTVQACAERRKAFKEHRNRLLPVYPECQECSQYYTVQKNQISKGEKSMAKIDQEKFKELVREGKKGKEIAESFGVSETAVWQTCKKLGLKLNSKRRGASATYPSPAPSRVPAPAPAIPVKMPTVNPEGQIIPVTLSLTLEVNVRVSTERA